MNRFVIREYDERPKGNVLLSLPKLVDRLAFVPVKFWSFRQLTLIGNSSFFGISIPDVEKLTNALSKGLVLANQDFLDFMKTDFQIIDGYIDGYDTSTEPLFQIECVDSTQWELSTNVAEIAIELENRGFCRG